MKSLFLTAILLTIAATGILYAQDRKKITNAGEKTYPRQKEVFYVLKDDETKRDGPYQFFRGDKVVVSGVYKNGQKDGVWEYYGFNGSVISRKLYAEGKKTGKWEFFSAKGEAEWSYDFATNTAAYQQSPPSDTATFFYLTDAGAWQRARLDKAPLALNSHAEWMSHLVSRLRYPNEAVEKNQQGTVAVYITADENGEPTEFTLSEGTAPSLKEEALRLIREFYHEFIPAEKNGKKVKSLYRASVTFKLEN